MSEKEWGNNKRFTALTVKRALLEHLQRLARADGKKVPEDLIAFMEASDIVFLDSENRPVVFERVILTWED